MKKIGMTLMMLSMAILPTISMAAFQGFKGEAAMPPSDVCWTGIYLGGNLGGKWGKFYDSIRTDTSSLAGLLIVPAETVSFRSMERTALAGVQLGFNYQYKALVAGIEGDLDGMRLRAKDTIGPYLETNIYVPGDSFRVWSYWQSSLRARVGYAKQEWLFYLTGGLALTDVNIKGSFVAANGYPGASGSSSRVLLGGTAGLGVEYALQNHWSIGGEYRYTSYQTKSVQLASIPTIAFATARGIGFVYAPVTARVRLRTSEWLFKVNYNFA